MSAADGERGPEQLPGHDVVLIRAANPGPLTLSGTNTWVVGRDPAWVVDPGPLMPAHLSALFAEIGARGGLGGIALTHDHADHSEAAPALRERYGAPLAAARAGDLPLRDGERVGPFEALATPGHAPDHFTLLAGPLGFTGDAVLGEGSVFISPHPGALAGYLRSLERLSARAELELLLPGHGAPVHDPHAKLRQYIDHRLERERRLRTALAEGRRGVEELLDAVWSEVPPALRPAAALTLAAHLDKLEEDGVLPADVERPAVGTLRA